MNYKAKEREEYDYFRVPKGSDRVYAVKRFPEGEELELEAEPFDIDDLTAKMRRETLEGVLSNVSDETQENVERQLAALRSPDTSPKT